MLEMDGSDYRIRQISRDLNERLLKGLGAPSADIIKMSSLKAATLASSDCTVAAQSDDDPMYESSCHSDSSSEYGDSDSDSSMVPVDRELQRNAHSKQPSASIRTKRGRVEQPMTSRSRRAQNAASNTKSKKKRTGRTN